MCRKSASGVHATCGDYRSVGIDRIRTYSIIDGKQVITWRHPLYDRWQYMLKRSAWKCRSAIHHGNNAVSYSDCTVCDEWLDFTHFYRWAMATGYRRELEIDRIDNARGYSPDNCRWVTHAEQLRNRRMTEKMRAANLRNLAKANAVNAARRAAARKEGAA